MLGIGHFTVNKADHESALVEYTDLLFKIVNLDFVSKIDRKETKHEE